MPLPQNLTNLSFAIRAERTVYSWATQFSNNRGDGVTVTNNYDNSVLNFVDSLKKFAIVGRQNYLRIHVDSSCQRCCSLASPLVLGNKDCAHPGISEDIC